MSEIYTPPDKKIIDEAWLGLGDIDDRFIVNPMSSLDPSSEDYHLHLTWMMTRPEYFSFICSEVFNIQILPSQALMLYEMWNRRFPMLIASRGYGKSFSLSLYAMLRALLMPNRKIVVVGAAFCQSKVLFEYMENIWANAPILRDICDSNSGPRKDPDRCVMQLNGSKVICLPLGDGSKIRGQRANDVCADEFASIPKEIFETVVAGFAAVSSDPVGNVKRIAAEKRAEELGYMADPHEKEMLKSKNNQIVVSGTAYYDFNHFADYWKRWASIIRSKGDRAKLREIFNGEDPPKDFDWRQFSIIRIPYELLPEGFMDAAQVARSKATVHAGIYQMEFGAVFTRDSQGFFKRSLIESCTAGENEDLLNPDGSMIDFQATLAGHTKKKYIFGVDPASEVDNFSIVVIEVCENHRRIVHCWTTTRQGHKQKVKSGFSQEKDFYAYCARKIRDLMKRFPCVHIAMDAQGGGIPVMESLHDPDKFEDGELAIWPVIDPDKGADTDDEMGLHILEMCQFADYKWLSEANHMLRKDLEDKVLLFPRYDAVTTAVANLDDGFNEKSYDTLEECVLDIEDLKDELAMIQITQTAAGRDRWDMPESLVATGKKERMRKDRYSALIMANMAARILARTPIASEYNFYGGFAARQTEKQKSENGGKMFQGPNWFTEGIKGVY